jgi:hypothetical protein
VARARICEADSAGEVGTAGARAGHPYNATDVADSERDRGRMDGMRRLIRGMFRRAVPVAVVAVLGHDLVYVAAYGAGAEAARRASGHEPYWTWTWLVVLLATAGLVAVSIAAALGLLRRLDRTDLPRRIALSPYLREVLRLWPRLALAALLVFVVQESVEHYVAHGGHVPGMQLLWSGEYAFTLPSFGLAALLVSAVAALFMRTLAILDAAVRRAAARPLRPPRRGPRPAWRDPRPRLLGTLATPDLGRAPPA